MAAERFLHGVAVVEVHVDALGDTNVAVSHHRGEHSDRDAAVCGDRCESVPQVVKGDRGPLCNSDQSHKGITLGRSRAERRVLLASHAVVDQMIQSVGSGSPLRGA